MKKIVKVCLVAFGFALSSFASLLFPSSAFSQENLTFNPQENPRKDIAVELGCGAVYSLSLCEYQLKPYEYSFSSGILTIYKSFLLGLQPGLNSFTAQTDEGEISFDVEVKRGKAASLKDDFGEQDISGWQYLYYNGNFGEPDIYDFDEYCHDLEELDVSILSDDKIIGWKSSYYDITLADMVTRIYYTNKFAALKWTPPVSGKYVITYDFKDKADKGGMAGFFRNSERLLMDFIIYGSSTRNGSFSVELSAGQSLYIAFQPLIHSDMYWEIAIEIFQQPYMVEFIDQGLTHIQYIYPSQLAEYFEPQRDGCRFLGWFLDEALTLQYDFGAPVCSDMALYAGWEQKFDFDARLSDNMITVEMQGSPLSQYQVWVKSAIGEVEESGGRKRQWEMVRQFFNETVLSFTACERYFFDGTCFIIVRAKKDGQIKDILKSFSFGGLGIEGIEVDGNALIGGMAVVQKPNPFTVSIAGGPFSQYVLKVDGIEWEANGTGEFNLNSSHFSRGTHVFSIDATEGELCHSVEFKIYFYEEYDAGKTPVILSLEGETDPDGLSQLKMKIALADGRNIAAEQAGELDVSLHLEGKGAQLVDFINDGEGILTALFRHSFNGHGIYRAVGKVAPKGGNTADTIIVYYSGFSRTAFLEQVASSYEAQVGATISIFANGWIEGEKDGYLYAFYREDASGWSLIRDYSPNAVLEWTHALAGRYNIQCRIKGVGEGSYEKSATRVYTVTAHALEGAIGIKVIDLLSGEEVTGGQLVAGKPYLFKAEAESEDALFMYTLTTKNLGTVYLDKYSPQGCLIFIPSKNDYLTIALRAINWRNFSFKDVDIKLSAVSIV